MTKKQREKVIEIIQNDCAIAFEYCNNDGKTCAIGALLLACGTTPDQLRSYNKQLPLQVNETLVENFGLTRGMWQQIQYLNDIGMTPEQRRIDILKFVNNIPV